MEILRKLFLHSPKSYIISICISSAITLLYLILKGFDVFVNYVNAFSVSGGIVLFLGLIGMVAYWGAFDVFGYSFSTFRKQSPYKDMYDYTQRKKEVRSREKLKFIPYIVTGAVFLIIGTVIGSFLPK